MTNFEISTLIANKLIKNEWKINSIEGVCVKAHKNYATIEVSFEMCSCHGGRLTICELNHTNNYHRIEHETYDEDLGIVDPESELLWEIENEMIETINKFYSKMVYEVVKIGEYDVEKESRDYFDDIDKAFNWLLKGLSSQFPNENVFSFSEGVANYPNPTCHLKIKRIFPNEEHSWDKNKYWFEFEDTMNDWKTSRKYKGYLAIFDKKRER